MGINFRKRISLGKYANVNLGKTGAGFSFGIPGARISVNSKGKTQASLGIPGTGLSYTKVLGTKKTKKKVLKNEQDNALGVEAYEQALFALSHIHTEAADPIDFSAPQIRYQSREVGPLQTKALEALSSYKPNFMDKIFNKDKQEELKQNVYEAMIKDGENREWLTIDSSLQELILKKDPKALHSLLDMVDAFEVFADDCDSYQLEFDINIDEVEGVLITIHTNMAEDVLDQVISLNPNGSTKAKKLSMSAFNERTYAYISSLVLGFVKEALAFLPLNEIHINVVDHSKNPNTGLSTQKNIVAAEFTREQLAPYDFDAINPTEVFQSGTVDCDFGVRKGWGEVEPIEVD